MVMVGVVALLTTVGCDPDYGVIVVGTTGEGLVVADGGHDSQVGELEDLEVVLAGWEGYVSSDGGMTWVWESTGEQSFHWGNDSVETPRGTYTIEGPEILLDAEGGRRVDYFATYLQDSGNIDLQEHATSGLGRRVVTPGPITAVYDEPSGNVVAAMGLEGVLVGSPDGKWARVRVGQYAPVNYSIIRKLLFLQDVELLIVALVMALSFIGFAIASLEGRVVLGFFAALASVFGVGLLGIESYELISIPDLLSGASLLVAPMLTLSIAVMVMSWRVFRQWRSILLALLVMLALIALSFFQWVQLGTSIALAKSLSVGLVALAGLGLRVYLASRIGH